MCEETPVPRKFTLLGCVSGEDFQKCRYALARLHSCLPGEFGEPEIRPLLDVEWHRLIVKYQRKVGGKTWDVKGKVLVLRDGEAVGDFEDLSEMIRKSWRLTLEADWHQLGCEHLRSYLKAILDRGLYNDLVPLTCQNFFERCQNGYAGTPVHRVVKGCWIQCGGFDLEPIDMACENYAVPHDKRGVASMCNAGPHKDNSTQFFVALDAAPWMDRKYVAFGQVIQGEEVLTQIENVSTYYESPIDKVTIVKAGEYSITLENGTSWQRSTSIIPAVLESEKHNLTRDSFFSHSRFVDGLYSLSTDLKSYGPFRHLQEYLIDNGESNEDERIGSASSDLLAHPKKKEIIQYSSAISMSDAKL
ncbi:probable inactive peptidyl-prolyl cis-trans isomerase-like 6 isoform X2 [Cylas formicarius]|uniref:probable inactive peptidyl-prolyl cis-trans isomerase-like 6 isoform X2 n=1 Tax=Cylas formicarius TaxID=197179 RepID=UPI002958ADD1|nr:probable inactive peptidyl-prolyl cis-trans isomerase-like 6 isoform X2 [Cylas formicarius]